MADETPTAAPVTAAPSGGEAAPAVVAVATPAVESNPVVQSPVVEAAPAIAPVVEAAPVSPEVVKSDAVEAPKPLLSPDAPKEEPKTDGTAEAPKVEPAPLPVYEFKLPEGANADNPVFKSFQSKLGEFQNLSKTEQAAVQKFGQEMIDMHLEDVKSVVENANKSAWDWFNNRNKEWLESAKKDPNIGGEKFNKTVSDASSAISLYGGTKAQQIETAKLLQETGLENSPIMLRFLSNITKIAAKEGTPVSGSNAPSKATFNPAQALFGGDRKAS